MAKAIEYRGVRIKIKRTFNESTISSLGYELTGYLASARWDGFDVVVYARHRCNVITWIKNKIDLRLDSGLTAEEWRKAQAVIDLVTRA